MVKEKDVHRINNSFESDSNPSTSNGSSNNATSNEWEFDFPFDHQQLKDYLFPNVDAYKPKRISVDKKYSEFTENHKINQSMHKFHRKNSFEHIGKTFFESGCISDHTFDSEEISDQDIGCQNEMKRFASNLKCMRENANLLNVSQFSIEPSSSPSDNDDTDNRSKRRSKTSGILTLSLNEDSCNAVDLPISARKCDDVKDIMTDLSFNGKIINEFSQASAIDDNGTETNANNTSGAAYDESVANTSSRSNLELFQLETSREIMNEQSPDMFADDDDDDDDIDPVYYVDEKDTEKDYFGDDSMTATNMAEKEVDEADLWNRKEKATSRRIQNLLSGIPPPPSITFCQHDIATMLELYNTNSKTLQTTDESGADSVDSGFTKDDFIPDELNGMEWPKVTNASAYGVHFHRSKYSDRIEMMYMKLAERHIGHETSSSFTFDASVNAAKKPARKIAASPGNRLSHLAKRRAAFSSASFKSQVQMPNTLNLGRKPCIIDASKLMKKTKTATPKRRIFSLTGRRTPGRKTPSSSKKATKNIALIIPTTTTATRETSKRALFLSPPNEDVKVPKFPPEVSDRVEKSKRALFSPPRRMERSISTMAYSSSNSSLNDINVGAKRRRENDSENVEPQNSKMAKCHSNATLTSRVTSNDLRNNSIAKASSENAVYGQQQLSASQRQKILWAVSTALKKKSVTAVHENFNNYASVLAKVVKRLYMQTIPSKTESTSATMLRLADRFVFWVIQGKTVDEIYLDEKKRLEATKNVATKLTGYIGPDEYAMRKERLNEASSSTERRSLNSSQSENTSVTQENSIGERKPLTNSSSKNNVTSSALRENHDSKSAQKNSSGFSGRNQKNLSPYNDKARSTSNLNKSNKLLIGGSVHSSLLKVKRQISFDN